MIDFINKIRNTDRYIEAIYTEGGCYQFHLLLKYLFPECVPMINSEANHVVTLYMGKYYDITGEIDDEDFHPMSEGEVDVAEGWSFCRTMAIQINECPACGEPIII